MASAAPMNFDDMFGGATTRVDYEDAPLTEHDYLPTPEPTDSLTTIAEKLTALSRVVQRGASVAVHTGFKRAAHKTLDAEATAKLAMTPPEAAQYDAWKAGAIMREMDWTRMQTGVPTGAGSAKRFEERAAAINIIWNTDQATDRNAAWVVKNYVAVLPLIVAVSKVEGASRDLTGGQKNLSEMDMAEIQTIHRINAIAMDRMNATFAAMRKLSAEINAAKDILQAREHALKSGIPEYKAKKDPVNDQRRAVGLPAIGKKVDYEAKISGVRAARTDLIGGTGLHRSNARKRARVAEPEVEMEEAEPSGQ